MHQNTINGIVPSSWIFFLLQQKTLHKEELTVSQKERMVKKQIETQAPKHQQKKSQEVAASGSKSSPSKVTTQGNYCFQTPTAKITKVMIQRDCCLPLLTTHPNPSNHQQKKSTIWQQVSTNYPHLAKHKQKNTKALLPSNTSRKNVPHKAVSPLHQR